MAEFRSREDLEQWLADKPPEYARLIAVRAALTVAPLLFAGLSPRNEPRNRMVLAGPRAQSLAWSALDGYVRPAAARAAARAVEYAAYAAHIGYAAANPGAYAAVDAAAAIWLRFSEVASRLERGETADAILKSPLDGPYEDEWRAGAVALLRDYPNWRFWTDWYEDRLAGRPLNPAFEQALLSLTESEWDRPVAEVNALLMRRMRDAAAERDTAEHSAPDLPEQDSRGARFVVGADGKIDFDPSATPDDFVRDKTIIALHQQLQTRAAALLSKCASNYTKDRIAPALTALLEALPSQLSQLAHEDAQVILWVAGLDIRARADAEIGAFERRDLDYGWIDPPALLDDLKALVAVYNVFNASLPRGSAFDENARNPAPPAPGVDEAALAARLAQAEADVAVISQRVAETHKTLDTLAKGDGPIADSARDAVKHSRKNLIIAAAGEALKFLKAASDAGKGVVAIAGAVNWLGQHKDDILAFVKFFNDHIASAIAWIIDHLPK